MFCRSALRLSFCENRLCVSQLIKKVNSTKRGAFFRHFCVSKVTTTAHALRSGVIFHFFPRAFKQTKKIKALRPKTTKGAQGGPALRRVLTLSAKFPRIRTCSGQINLYEGEIAVNLVKQIKFKWIYALYRIHVHVDSRTCRPPRWVRAKKYMHNWYCCFRAKTLPVEVCAWSSTTAANMYQF